MFRIECQVCNIHKATIKKKWSESSAGRRLLEDAIMACSSSPSQKKKQKKTCRKRLSVTCHKLLSINNKSWARICFGETGRDVFSHQRRFLSPLWCASEKVSYPHQPGKFCLVKCDRNQAELTIKPAFTMRTIYTFICSTKVLFHTSFEKRLLSRERK